MNDFKEKVLNSFDELLDSAKIHRTGGAFNGDIPVIFEQDTVILESLTSHLREPIKSFISQALDNLLVEVEGELKRLAHNDTHESENWKMKTAYRVVHLESALQALATFKKK